MMPIRLPAFSFLFVCAAFFLSTGVRAEQITLVVLGDSLVAGYQLAPEKAFPDQLEGALREDGLDVKVVNAGVSGDTTTGGLSRLDWSVGEDADAVIVELGANDALRGLPPETTRTNLDEIVGRLTERGLPVLVAGMLAPRNLGEDYQAAYDTIFKEVADAHDALLYPFFLEGVALNPKLNLGDGMHPNAEGVSVIVRNMLPVVKDLLQLAGTD